MKKTLLVSLLLALGPVAASADAISIGDKGPATSLEQACALQSASCMVVERRMR